MDWERKREEGKEQTEERGKVWDFEREKLHLLSKFPDDRTGVRKRSKRES